MRSESQNTTLLPNSVVGAALMAAVLIVSCGTSANDAVPDEETTTTAIETTVASPDEEAEHDHEHEEDHDHDHDNDSDSGSDGGESAADESPVDLDEPRRLLVAAAFDQPSIDLVDLGDESTVTVELESPATLASSLTESGRFLFAGHGDGVTVVDTGVWSERHGDHFHHYTVTPSVIDRVEGPNPSHLVSHGDLSALYFDGTGEAVVIDEEGLEKGRIDVVETITTGEPHHGFAVPTQGAFVATAPSEDMDELPNLVGVKDPDGAAQEPFDCPLTHGEAGLPNGAAAACGDGVLLVTQDDGAWTGTHLRYPQVDDEDPYGYGAARAWAFETSPSQNLLAAPYGTRHLLIVDLSNQSLTAFDLELGVATLGVAFDDDGQIVVLTLDGALLSVDSDDGSILSSVEAISPFQEGDPEEPYRQMAISDGHAYVSDPATGQVVEVSLEDGLAVERTFDLGFAPGFIAVANG